MSQPVPYERDYSFIGWQSANPTRPLPADKLEVELEAIETTFDQILANLALIQRDDGALANVSVGYDQLKPEVIIGMAQPTEALAAATIAAAYAKFTATSRTALAIADPNVTPVIYLNEGGRSGDFTWAVGNYAARVASDTRQARYVASASDPTGAAGAWVRADPILRLEQFGIGVGQDTAALQAFFDEGTKWPYVSAIQNGTVVLTGPVTWGQASTESATSEWTGQLHITAPTGSGFAVITIQKMDYCRIGDIFAEIFIGQTFASRTRYTNGVYVKDASRLSYGTISVYGISGFAALMPSSAASGTNNNFAIGGRVIGVDCGSGCNYDTYGSNLRSAWTRGTDTGSASNVAQRTPITCVTLPPTDIITMLGEAYGAPIAAVIAGEPYQVESINTGTSVVTLIGWVDLALTSGTLTWVFGGADLCSGGDGGLRSIAHVTATRCGIGSVDAASYPGTTAVVAAQYVGINYWRGRSPGTVTLGGNVALYCEGTWFDIVSTLRGAASNTYFQVTNSHALSLSRCINVAKVRNLSNVLLGQYSAINGAAYVEGASFPAGKLGLNYANSGSFYSFEIGTPDIHHSLNKAAVTLTPILPKLGAVARMGADTSYVHLLGTAASRAPTSVTINVPTARAFTATFDVAKNAAVIKADTDLRTGHKVRFTTTGTLPAVLTPGTDYFLVRTDASWVIDTTRTTYFGIATSLANAQAYPPTLVAIADVGSGVHTATQPVFLNGAEVAVVLNAPRAETSLVFYFSELENDVRVGQISGDTNCVTATLVTDPPDLAAGLTQTFSVTVPGAVVGMPANAAFSLYNASMRWVAMVSAADTVTVFQTNTSGGSINLASGTIRVDVFK